MSDRPTDSTFSTTCANPTTHARTDSTPETAVTTTNISTFKLVCARTPSQMDAKILDAVAEPTDSTELTTSAHPTPGAKTDSTVHSPAALDNTSTSPATLAEPTCQLDAETPDVPESPTDSTWSTMSATATTSVTTDSTPDSPARTTATTTSRVDSASQMFHPDVKILDVLDVEMDSSFSTTCAHLTSDAREDSTL